MRDVVQGAGANAVTTVHVSGGVKLIAPANALEAEPGTVIVLGARAMPFGALAPDLVFMPDAVRRVHGVSLAPSTDLPTVWKNFTVFEAGTSALFLDSVHASAAVDRAVLFVAPGSTQPATITAVAENPHSEFGMSARTTWITVAGLANQGALDNAVRELSILIETSRLSLVVPLADPALPLTTPGARQHDAVPATPQADRLQVAGHHLLPTGRRVVLIGTSAVSQERISETAVVAAATVITSAGAPAATLLRFEAPLEHRFRASSLEILANSVSASQALSAPFLPGAATAGGEVLGSGDPSTVLPRFRLHRGPLAHLPAPGTVGYAPALEVRVDSREYERTESIPGDDPSSRAYRVAEIADDSFEVQFAGRLPTGTGNVTAAYRTGGGAAGNVAENRLEQLVTPVPGIRNVRNRVPAEGGSDAESVDQLRETAPRAIRTLGRAVALSDFAALADGYRGVGRSSVAELLVDRRRTVVVTVATTSYDAPASGSPLLRALRQAIEEASPPGTRVVVQGFVDQAMSLILDITHDTAFRRRDVQDRVRHALTARFGREVRPFARAVHRSEVIAAVQAVEGVRSVRLVGFDADGVVEDTAGRLPCAGPRVVGGIVRPARRLSLRADAIEFTEPAS
ncbi:baseplate J/gp47 family protein [Agromyces sp. NPDC056379]|uniref:baseplate J/gp47 family protein n=1 Tax=unclassified Agromyces TaxID=2639701 RepID=UPI0035D724E0